MIDEAIWLLPALGVLCGIFLGGVARLYRFCTLTSLERYWYANDSRGLRSWILAATTAILTTQFLLFMDVISVEESFYLTPRLNLIGAILGGLMFGFGMALVGTCGFGALVRVGGGSLQSLVVVTSIGLAALSTQIGVIGIFRESAIEPTALLFTTSNNASIPALLSDWLSTDLYWWVVVIVLITLLIWVFSNKEFRAYRPGVISGLVIGLCVTFGWFVSSYASNHLYEPVQTESASFVLPPGQLIYWLISTASPALDYGMGLVAGVVLGAFLVALKQRDIRWEACDDARELNRHLIGGFLMGLGGVLAGGCTIGQGVSAMSLLAVSAPVVFISMCLGARLGLSWLLEGFSFKQ